MVPVQDEDGAVFRNACVVEPGGDPDVPFPVSGDRSDGLVRRFSGHGNRCEGALPGIIMEKSVVAGPDPPVAFRVLPDAGGRLDRQVHAATVPFFVQQPDCVLGQEVRTSGAELAAEPEFGMFLGRQTLPASIRRETEEVIALQEEDIPLGVIPDGRGRLHRPFRQQGQPVRPDGIFS